MSNEIRCSMNILFFLELSKYKSMRSFIDELMYHGYIRRIFHFVKDICHTSSGE